jgi:hypothetical protein
MEVLGISDGYENAWFYDGGSDMDIYENLSYNTTSNII